MSREPLRERISKGMITECLDKKQSLGRLMELVTGQVSSSMIGHTGEISSQIVYLTLSARDSQSNQTSALHSSNKRGLQ